MALPTNAKPDDSSQRDRFREQVTAIRRQAGQQQQELAAALGLAPHVLSRKLRGLDGAQLTYPEVKEIVRTLASWDALGSREEALALLALAGLGPAIISDEEWNSPPLNRLRRAGPRPSVPAGGSVTPAPPGLPMPATRLVGREALLQLVCERLRDPQVRLLTLFGPGGVGKTRLSLAVARALVPDFADGVYFVPWARYVTHPSYQARWCRRLPCGPLRWSGAPSLILS
jgi:transcriptional regulator with XRE-family HTH domain